MSIFSKIGKGLSKLAGGVVKGVGAVVKGAVGIAAGAIGLGGTGQPSVRIAVESTPETGVRTEATVTREPASPITEAGADRTQLGEANALGGNTGLLIMGGLLAFLLLSGRR